MALGIWNKFSLWLEHIGTTALILGLKEVITELAPVEDAAEAFNPVDDINPVIGLLEVSPVIEGT